MKKLFLNLIAFLIIFTALSCGGRDETDLVIFFNLFEPGGYYICSIDENGGNFKKIAGPFQAVTSPVCSSDGSRIVFSKTVTVGPDTMAQIWTMNTDGSDMKQETSPAADQYHYFPTWSADSRYIYFVQYELPAGINYSALYKLDMKTGLVTSDNSHSYSNASAVACYEDYIAYWDFDLVAISVLNINTNVNVFATMLGLSYPTYFYDGRLACSVSSEIYIYESDFSSYSSIDFTSQGLNPVYLAVSPDGEKIVFVDSGSGYLWIYDIKNGGNAVLLKTGPCTSPNYIAKPR
ncbi:MAG TPA: hypothetical protein PLY36_00540 [Spirochaetota bacterium]|nr:hypothetical protein [Spirochaetota bacterium]